MMMLDWKGAPATESLDMPRPQFQFNLRRAILATTMFALAMAPYPIVLSLEPGDISPPMLRPVGYLLSAWMGGCLLAGVGCIIGRPLVSGLFGAVSCMVLFHIDYN